MNDKYLSPLALAAQWYEYLDHEVENDTAPVLSEELQAAFKGSGQTLAFLVDAKIALKHKIEANIAAIETDYKWIKNLLAFKKKQLEAFKAQMDADMNAAPEVTFRGNLGKISLIAYEKVELVFGPGDAITADMKSMFGIDDKYVRPTYYVLKERVKADLKEGKYLQWAAITTTKKARFPAEKKPKIEGESNEHVIDISPERQRMAANDPNEHHAGQERFPTDVD